MSYEDRHDSRKDPTAECPDVPCGPFKASDCTPAPCTDWCVTAEGDVYGLMLHTEEDAKKWAAAMNDAYEAGYASGQHDLQDELRSLRGLKRCVDEALNSGDGTYRP